VAEETPDGRETLKVIITTSNAGGQAQKGGMHGNLFCASWEVRCPGADGPEHRRTVRGIPVDGPAKLWSHKDCVPSNHDDQRYVRGKLIHLRQLVGLSKIWPNL
jgi:hypothetical protein